MEQNRPETERARRCFQTKLSRVPAQDLVFVDESGVRTDLTRHYGRAPKGERVREAVPHGHGKVLHHLRSADDPRRAGQYDD